MWKNNGDFSSLLSSKDARALASLLGRMDPALLSQAARAASGGDPEEARRLLGPVMEDPQIRELLERMGGQYGGT